MTLWHHWRKQMNAAANTKIKICGIRTPDAMTAALEGGADFVGLNFIPASPRYVEIEVAAYLANYVPADIRIVGLFADSPRGKIEEVLNNVRIDLIQLHGQETPEECAGIAATFGKPVMKALPADQIKEKAAYYAAICDWLLIDAPKHGELTGGSGQTFDWDILQDFRPSRPWMLAGGLNPENVGQAIHTLKPDAVDVSSGVEITRGVKDPSKIRAFIEAVRRA